MAQNKMGRPLSGVSPKNDRIFIRVDDETKDKLEKCKEAFGLTTSEIVRQGIDRMCEDLEQMDLP